MPIVEFPNAEVVAQSDGAICVLFEDEEEGYDEPHWIPRSVIDKDSEVSTTGDKGLLVIFKWFAEKEGLV